MKSELSKNILILILISLLTFSCTPKQKTKNDELEPIKTREYEANVDKRIANSSGITLFGKRDESSFAKQNVMWRATLQSLSSFPISVASYEGGIIATDWYSSTNQKESVKIQVNFLSTQVATSSFEVITYKKECSKINEKENCKTFIMKDGELAKNIKEKIIDNIRLENIKASKSTAK